MTERITPESFLAAEGVEDWRVVANLACARFRTGSFARGVELVTRIGALADAADHHPDVDLRYGGVSVRLVTHDVGGLTERDLELARAISVAARELDIPAAPATIQRVHLAIDAMVPDEVRPFWRAVLGYREPGEEDLADPRAEGPWISFHQMDAPRPDRNRIHVDVYVPHDEVEARIEAALAAGGHLVTDRFAPGWWTLADAEGNECDVATWWGRG